MTNTSRFAQIASLAGEPARANMLHGLLDGRALTATELAQLSGVTPQTASGHLAKLVDANLIEVLKQGRHRYFRLASPAVAHMMEAIMEVASLGPEAGRQISTGPRDKALREARTCYNHMAGRLSVDIAETLTRRGFIQLGPEAGLITEAGLRFFCEIGMPLKSGSEHTPHLCRACLDWSERRLHIAGALGTHLLDHCVEKQWVRRSKASRVLTITPSGHRVFREVFGIGVQTPETKISA